MRKPRCARFSVCLGAVAGYTCSSLQDTPIRHCERSEAIHIRMDCFVASLLAKTWIASSLAPRNDVDCFVASLLAKTGAFCNSFFSYITVVTAAPVLFDSNAASITFMTLSACSPVTLSSALPFRVSTTFL